MSKEDQNKRKSGKRVNTSGLTEEKNPKKRKIVKNTDEDGITKSKQLSEKNSKSTYTKRTEKQCLNTNPRICPNGKPMPSLAELEKMYEDSEDENFSTNREIISPESVKKIASNVVEALSKITDPSELLDILPPQPIVPQKKPKKSGAPYIIGCKDRPQVIRKPATNWAQGDDEYGVHVNATEPEDLLDVPYQRKKRSKRVNLSKSQFNAQSDDIASTLRDNENLSDGSTTSDKTIPYFDDTFNATTSPSSRSFSPLPSTSKDSQTFLKNDQRFFESFENDDSDSDVEIIQTPYETIIIHETNITPMQPDNDDDAVQFVKEENKPNDTGNTDLVVDEDFYSSFQINEIYDDVEIINVDDIIAENNAIIEKYRRAKNQETSSITDIVPISSHPSSEPINTSNSQMGMPEVNSSDSQHNTTDLVTNLEAPSCIVSEQENIVTNVDTQQTSGVTSSKFMDKIRIVSDIVTDFFKSWQPPICEFITESQIQPQENLPQNIESIDLTTVNIDTPNPKPRTGVGHLLDRIAESITRISPMSSVQAFTCPSAVQIDTQPTANKQGKQNKRKTKRKSCKNTSEEPPPQPSRGASMFGDCPICMDTLGTTSVASTMCGHVFCLSCIQASIRANGKKCPSCRKSLKGAGYHQLFI